MPTLKMFGFCGVGVFNRRMLGLMPITEAEAGKPHRATISVLAKQCELANLVPEFTFFDGTGEQHLGWNLGTKTLSFAGGGGNATWVNRATTIDLDKFHHGDAIKTPDSDYATVELTDGELHGSAETQRFVIKHSTNPPARHISIAVELRTALRTLQIDGTPLVVLRGSAVATVANLAHVLLGHQHFHHYYSEFFVKEPTDQVSLSNSGVEIFDCVPPAPLP